MGGRPQVRIETLIGPNKSTPQIWNGLTDSNLSAGRFPIIWFIRTGLYLKQLMHFRTTRVHSLRAFINMIFCRRRPIIVFAFAWQFLKCKFRRYKSTIWFLQGSNIGNLAFSELGACKSLPPTRISENRIPASENFCMKGFIICKLGCKTCPFLIFLYSSTKTFLYPGRGYIDFSQKFATQWRRRFRPHKVYIFLISMTRRVDLAMSAVRPFLRKLVSQF